MKKIIMTMICVFLASCDEYTVLNKPMKAIDIDNKYVARYTILTYDFYKNLGLNEEAAIALQIYFHLSALSEDKNTKTPLIQTEADAKTLFACLNADGRATNIYKNRRKLNKIATEYNIAANEYNDKVAKYTEGTDNVCIRPQEECDKARNDFTEKYGENYVSGKRDQFEAIIGFGFAAKICIDDTGLIREKSDSSEYLIQILD